MGESRDEAPGGRPQRPWASPLDEPDFNQRLFHPRRDHRDPPTGARDLRVDVAGEPLAAGDAAEVQVRLHERPGSRACVLFFHGNGEVVSDYDRFAPRFAAAGADLAVADYRGYGRSTGTPTLRRVLEDAHLVLRAVEAERQGAANRPLVVHGRSLGSACAAELCGPEEPAVAGVIFESGFSDVPALVRRLRARVGPLEQRDLDAFGPLRKLGRSTRPLLVLHGSEDDLIPPEEAVAAHAHAGAAVRRLALLPGAGHNDILLRPDYWREVERFITEVCGG